MRIGGKLDQEELKIAFAFILSMPGAPFIFYGDEIGMRWIPDLPSHEGSRQLRAGSRTPMQWSADEVNDDFSESRPDRLYFPLDPNPDRPRVEAQMAKEDSLWHEVHKLIDLRLAHEALQSNAPVEFLSGDDFPLVYLRKDETETVLICINPKGTPTRISCSLESLGERIYSNHGTAELKDGMLYIPAASACMFRIEK